LFPREIRHYFDHLLAGVVTEARRFERLGIQMIHRPTVRLGVEEVETLSQLVELGIQAIIITPGDPAKLTPIIDAAEEKNIRVVCVDTDAPASRRSAVVCINTEVSGKLAAELMSSIVAQKSTVAVLTGMLNIDAHAKMTRSFCELYPQLSDGGEVLKVIEAHEDEEEAFQKSYLLLKEFKSLAGIYVTTVNCLPVCRALCALGLSGKVALVTSDLFRGMAPYFEKGTIRASVHGRPFMQGQVAMRMVIDNVLNGRPLQRVRYISPHIILQSNFHLFREIHHLEGDGELDFPSLTRLSVW